MSQLTDRFVICAGIVAGILSLFLFSGTTLAVTGADWRAGNIMSDSVFFNSSTMSTSDIQSFLNSKVPNCDTWGSQPYAGTTRAAYAASKGVSTPFTCLKNYSQNGKSAAQIIKDAANTYNVSPKVLLVLLQKEQSLVTDDWPWPIQYRGATGYGCPDTAPCDAEYYGFTNQVNKAAWQFTRYAANPSEYRYKSGQSNYIQWNPNAGCGGSNVAITNQTTAGLYNYTPYQPNQAALNNLYGTGDGCSAYGNRNFWRLYSDWFGSTQGIEVKGSIKIKYDSINGINLLGTPLDNEQTDGRGFWWQRFANGYIVGSAGTGYYVSKGSIRLKWAETGYQNGQLGLPVSDEAYSAENNIWSQVYEGGEIKTYSNGSYRIVIKGSIFTAYKGFNNKYNMPLDDENTNGSGFWWQRFVNGYIVGSARTGYYESAGSIRLKWAETGYQNGQLGLPVGNILETSPGCYSQSFEKGTISGCSGEYHLST